MANFPYISGDSPLCWQNCIDIIIPKKVNNNFIEDSRGIVLFELDANMNQKHLGRSMMRLTESQGSLMKE